MAIFTEEMMRKRYGYLNLNESAREWLHARGEDPDLSTRFANPIVTHRMEEAAHRQLGLDWSYGGWLEDRSTIRRGTYLDKGRKYFHLGIDVNVNPGVEVYPVSSEVIAYVGDDTESFGTGGWGRHIIQRAYFGPHPGVIIYAHLGKVLVRPGDRPVGRKIATVGSYATNGNWRPHLHLQALYLDDPTPDWETFSQELDGYVRKDELGYWARRSPDPTPLIFGGTIW